MRMDRTTGSSLIGGYIYAIIVITAMLGVFVFLGRYTLGRAGMMLVLGVSVLSLVHAARFAHARLLSQAVAVRYESAPFLVDAVVRLSREAEIVKVPRLFVLPSPTPNALTVGGRKDPSIVITSGLLQRLSGRELEGVLAHEIAHIANDDLRILTVAESVRQSTLALSQMGQILILIGFPFLFMAGEPFPWGFVGMAVLAPFISLALHFSLMRNREFAADATAARITGDARGLASALRSIESPRSGIFNVLMPTQKKESGALFRSHPATEQRIQRLLEIDDQAFGESSGRSAWPFRHGDGMTRVV